MIRHLILLLLLAGGLMLAVPSQVQAKDLFDNQVCSNPQTAKSAVCTGNKQTDSNQDPLSGKDGLLIKITNIVAVIGGAIAVIMIMIGALRFITSGSDISTGSRTDTDVENARNTIINALIGLAVIVLARTIILFVIHKINNP